jgi:hypothetical protein
MGSRVAVLLLTLWTLGGALAGSLVIASPADYPGDLIVALGTGITLVCTGLGIRGLLWATTTRITNG